MAKLKFKNLPDIAAGVTGSFTSKIPAAMQGFLMYQVNLVVGCAGALAFEFL